MDRSDIERFLAETLADRKLSGGEKQALTKWVEANARSAQEKGVIRHAAFDLARSAVSDPESLRVLDWIEDVLKAVAPIQSNATAPDMSLDSAYFSPGEECLQRIIRRFQFVKNTADLCVFTITDDRISRVILEAHRRGVKMRIISDAGKAGDLGSDLAEFRNEGIAVKLVRVMSTDLRSEGHMHHKFAIFDGLRMINGSYNWTRGAANVNYENLVDTADAGLLKRFNAEFDRLWEM
jgi:cardiolipin hydrolase